MPKLEVPHLFKLDVSLDDVLKASREILKHTKDRQFRNALKTMFREIKKVDTQFVRGVLVPLFELRTQERFDKGFDDIHQRFKTILHDEKGLLFQINCGKVTNKLEALQRSQAWKKRLPLLNRSFARLELAAHGWIFNDSMLHQADQELMTEINDFMDAIYDLHSADPKQALAELKAGLKGIEKDYMRIKDYMAEFEVLSDKL